MQVTDETTYENFRSVEKYITENSTRALKRCAEEKYGTMYSLTFERFHDCLSGAFECVLGKMTKPTVLQVYWQKRFAEFINEFTNALKSMTMSQTADEITASAGLLKTEWDEGLLIFLQQFFGLKSFREAEQITIGEVLMAKKASYNREKFQRQMFEIQRRKRKNI